MSGDVGSVLRRVAADPPGQGAAAGVSAHVSEHGWTELVAAAGWHGVAGALARSAAVAGLAGTPGAEGLRAEVRRTALRHARTLADLAEVRAALADTGVEPVVVKGPVLAEDVYPEPGLRSYVDLDVVVPPETLGPVLSALDRCGFTVLDRNWPLMRELSVGQIQVRAPSGGLVDLHWHLLNQPGLRSAFRLDRSLWGDRLHRVVLGGAPVRTLDPVMTMVHLGVHGALSGGHRLVWLTDLQRVLFRFDPDWDEVAAAARATRTGLPLQLMLSRLRRVLGHEVPDRVLRDLAPSSWRAVTAAADRLSPVTRTPAAGSLAQLVARSCRGGTASSSREFVGRAAAWARHSIRPGPRRSGGLHDPGDPGSTAFAAGGPEDRAAFLAAAARLP